MTQDAAPPASPTLPMTRECPFDPAPEYGQLRDETPLARVRVPAGFDAWLVTRHEDVRTVLADATTFSSCDAPFNHLPGGSLGQPIAPGMFIQMDGPEHARLRRRLTGEFTVRRMQALRPRIQQMVDEHIDTMAGKTSADLYTDFGLPIPSLVISELLGVPREDREDFQKWGNDLINMETPAEEKAATGEQVGAYIFSLVQKKREHPGDDLLSRLITRYGDATDPFTDEELVGAGILLLIAGHETTANMITLGTANLLRNPRQLEALQEDPSLVGQAIEEELRFLTIVQYGLLRQVTAETTLRGRHIPAGDYVVVALPAANRDPEQFPDPDELDITRSARGHVAFGYGPHQCIGQNLARVELEVAWNTLFRRIPTLRLATGLDEVPFRDEMTVYGAHALPVTWDRVH